MSNIKELINHCTVTYTKLYNKEGLYCVTDRV